MTSAHVPVLVVGGGLVGLSAALFLEYHGVPYVLVERRATPSPLPRSRGLHTRTGEMYRQVGLESRILATAATALKAGKFGGAWTGESVRTAEALDLSAFGASIAAGADPSPAQFVFVPQVQLEPVLAQAARERGGDLRFGTELVEFAQDADGVTAVLRDAAGARSPLRADYLIAADGAGSPIRAALGITGSELPPTHHYLNVFARTDLTGILDGRGFSQCEITGPRVRGLVLTKNNTDEWSFHIEYDPAVESPADWSDARCVDAIRAMIGAPGLGVQILARSAWDTGTFVADDYRRDRVFLVGDAAHRHAPWGGYGGNTGVADAHNLVWKLAATLHGTAGGALLDSYAAERRPRARIAVEQSRLGTDFRTRYGIRTRDNAGDLARRLDMSAVMTRYRYTSTAVLDTADRSPHVPALHGQTGTRLPHWWVDAGTWTLSTLDLCGPGFTLLIAGPAGAWREAAAKAQRDTGIDIAVHALPASDCAERAGLSEGQALLVRPDHHIAAGPDSGLTPAWLGEVLELVSDTRNARPVLA
ncbi:FAD-dependent monooxygenase [Nocardia sp. CDC153]|uniref:FAD-dependent monooxygenase n=1 Tax=Nocardia sp. CDC153 TaxID=3112167 RepID=UPI002DB79BD5|nr:FAD-dependent monooxygenase [Nocardia sp. CDC153]MEC3958280.1 FAD-dependent monooxygenase [Nocardia sp. CDC153]